MKKNTETHSQSVKKRLSEDQEDFHLRNELNRFIFFSLTRTQNKRNLARYWDASGSEATREDETEVLVDHSTEG